MKNAIEKVKKLVEEDLNTHQKRDKGKRPTLKDYHPYLDAPK